MEYIKINKYPQTIKEIRKENISSFNSLNFEKLRELGIKEDTNFTFCDDKTNQLFQIWIIEERLENEEELEARIKKEESHNRNCDRWHQDMRRKYKEKYIIDDTLKKHSESIDLEEIAELEPMTLADFMKLYQLELDSIIDIEEFSWCGKYSFFLNVIYNKIETEEQCAKRNAGRVEFNKKYDEYHSKYNLDGTVKV